MEMVNPQLLLTPQNVFHHTNYLALNPNAPEFYPFNYYFTPPNQNNTTIITTNFHINPNNNYHYDHYPHHNFYYQNPNYFQDYPFPYFTPIDNHQNYPIHINPNNNNNNNNNNNYYYYNNQNYQNALLNPNETPMQPEWQPRSRPRPRPKRVYFRDHGGEKGSSGCGSGSGGNNGMKEGYFGKKDDLVRFRGLGYRGKIGKNVRIMPVKCDGWETTAMIRNVPNQYTRGMLVKFLDDFCHKENKKLKEAIDKDDNHPPLAFDFAYLPIDFRTKANKGYAFVNFTHPSAVWKFHLAYSDRGWDYCNSPKICQIAYASIQGKENLMEHFGRSRFNCNEEEYLPVCFIPPRDGSGFSVNPTTIGERVSSS